MQARTRCVTIADRELQRRRIIWRLYSLKICFVRRRRIPSSSIKTQPKKKLCKAAHHTLGKEEKRTGRRSSSSSSSSTMMIAGPPILLGIFLSASPPHLFFPPFCLPTRLPPSPFSFAFLAFAFRILPLARATFASAVCPSRPSPLLVHTPHHSIDHVLQTTANNQFWSAGVCDQVMTSDTCTTEQRSHSASRKSIHKTTSL